MCGYGYGVRNANPWLYRNPYRSIMGLYGYEVKNFIFIFIIILLFYILHEGKSDNYVKDFICFRSVHRPFAPVWSGLLTLESSLSYLSFSLALAVSRCHRHSGCFHSVTTLSAFIGTTAVTALAQRSAALQQARRAATSQAANDFQLDWRRGRRETRERDEEE